MAAKRYIPTVQEIIRFAIACNVMFFLLKRFSPEGLKQCFRV